MDYPVLVLHSSVMVKTTKRKGFGGNIRLDWVCHPACGWVDNTNGQKKRSYKSYQYGEIIFKILSEQNTYEEVLK